MREKQLLQQIGWVLIAESQSDQVDWEKVKRAGIDLQLLAFDQEQGKTRGGFELCR